MKPLEGVKVIELATYLAAPSCCRMLADWGAEVIKVEALEGDIYRTLGTNQRIPIYGDSVGNPSFDNENVNKKFVSFNLKTQLGMEAFLKLLSTADVFVTNNRPKALKKLHIAYEDLSVKFPGLVFADILGYGEKGPDKDKPGFDYTTFYARTGLMVDLSPKGQDVLNTIPGFGDHLAGIALAAGVCAALYKKKVSGVGDRVDVGLYQAGIYVLSSGILSAYYGRKYPKARNEPNTPISNSYKCKDGEWVYLAATNFKGQWGKFCIEVLDRQDLANNPNYNTLTEILKRLPEAVGILDEIFASKDSNEWVTLLKKADIAHEKIQHFSDVLKDEQAWVNNYLREYTYSNGEKGVFSNSPITFDSIGEPPFEIAKEIGSDTKEVMLDIGYSQEEIDNMEADNDIRVK